MKTKLFLFAALLITTITFSQTTKKGYDHYKAKSASSKKMNKGELTSFVVRTTVSDDTGRQVIAKEVNTGKKIKSRGNINGLPTGKRTYRANSKTIQENQKAEARHNWMSNPSRAGIKQTKAPGDPIPDMDITVEQGNSKNLRKRPGRVKTEKNQFKQEFGQTKANSIRKKPGRTKATDYNSSRSNKSEQS